MRPSFLRPLCRVLAASVLCLALGSCEVEEEVRLAADGSGSYRAKVSVEKGMAEALPQLRAQAEGRGFTVVEEGETADRKFIVIERSFDDVSELNDDKDSYELTIERSNPFTASYRLALDFRGNPSASGFTRTLRVFMPARVRSASVGTIAGDSVLWDCSRPGKLELQAAGLAPTLSSGQRKIALFVLVGGALLLVGLRAARRNAPAPGCPGCGNRLDDAALFCPTCGARRSGAPRAA